MGPMPGGLRVWWALGSMPGGLHAWWAQCLVGSRSGGLSAWWAPGLVGSVSSGLREYVRIVNMSEGQAPATHHGSNLIVHLCTSLKFNFPSAVPLGSLLILLSGIVSQVNQEEAFRGQEQADKGLL